MTDKMISAVYRALSITVWGCTMALLIFIILLFCTGKKQHPVFKVESVTISDIGEDTGNGTGITTSNGWYKADFKVRVQGAALSPYTYTVNNVVFNQTDRHNKDKYILSCPDEIVYSYLSPADFTLTLYLKCGSAENAANIAADAAFGFRGVKQCFSFFYKELVMDLPGFRVKDSGTEPIIV